MNDPVAWQLWTPETLALAKKHDRPLFLSIGYASCHCMRFIFLLFEIQLLTLDKRVPCHAP